MNRKHSSTILLFGNKNEMAYVRNSIFCLFFALLGGCYFILLHKQHTRVCVYVWQFLFLTGKIKKRDKETPVKLRRVGRHRETNILPIHHHTTFSLRVYILFSHAPIHHEMKFQLFLSWNIDFIVLCARMLQRRQMESCHFIPVMNRILKAILKMHKNSLFTQVSCTLSKILLNAVTIICPSSLHKNECGVI